MAGASVHQPERCKLCSNLIIDEDEPRGTGLHGAPYVSYLEESHKNGCRFCGYLLQIEHLLGTFVRWNFIGDSYSGYCERPTFESLKISDPTCLTSRGERIVVRPFQVWHKSLEIYREHSGLPSPFSKPIAVGERADSPSTWTFLQDCLAWCATHASCAQEGLLRLPTRLLHLDSSAGTVSLVETKQGEAMPYVALSHCWGGDLPVKLTTANYELLRRGLPWGCLPNTFQDAAVVASRFDIAYIWIDALCIIQDDTADWAKEAAKMADVYSNAHFTISAASSKDGSISFLKQQRTMPLVLGLEDNMDIDGPPERLLARKRFETGIHSYGKVFDATLDPTDLRGWIMQEKVLSRRTMVFSSEEVQWECRKARVCECSGITPWDSNIDQRMHGTARQDPRKASRGPASLETWRSCSPEQRHESWNTLVMDYTLRSLTNETDKLVALSGMAKKFSSYDSSAYYAGIWHSSLPSGLCWYVYQHYRVQSLLPQSYIAPSFSWASVKGNVDFMPAAAGPGSVSACAIINSAIVSLATADPFGAVLSGSITLAGVLMAGEMCYDSSWAGIRVNRKSGNRGAYTVSFKGTVELMSDQELPQFFHDCELIPQGSSGVDAGGEQATGGVARSSEASPTSWGPCKVYLLPLYMATPTTSWGVKIGMYGLVLGRRPGGTGNFERLGLYPFGFDFGGLDSEDMSSREERIRGFFAAGTPQVVVIRIVGGLSRHDTIIINQ
ncbi:heterokaryon incompatibility protein-domain-containing protein [Podospora didyma]|uniref:Heterokaryon incompatibility protein-domain-containing protein n=1 Tax=Podospora didyma TaxID=330526 RepID=A0AAE0NRY1_9PEZI|nr:heterokaryon incompatibility protein-domain-containing protein [Podospora didyma]